jgi:hypothetical protein
VARTVAFPVIGIGLDSSPLKKGLNEAKAAVGAAAADIKKSTKALTSAPGDVYALKPDDRPTGASVMDVVDRFNARRAQDMAAKKAAQAAKVAEKAAADAAKRADSFFEGSSASLIPPDVQSALDDLLREERTLKKITDNRLARGLEIAADRVIEIRGRVEQRLGSWSQSLGQTGLARFLRGSGATSVPGMALGGGLAVGRGALGVAGSGISALANLPGTLSSMALPLNQTLELAGKAQRLLGAPVRSAMAIEANSNQAVWEGGRSALNDKGWSGTLQRFSIGLDRALSKGLEILDKGFNLRGWMEAGRGVIDGFTRVADAFSSLMGPQNENFEEMFMAGQDVAIDLTHQMVDLLADIYNAGLDTVERLVYVYEAIRNPFSTQAFYKALHEDLAMLGLRDRQGNQLGRIDKGETKAFFDGVREQLEIDRIHNFWQGEANNALDVDPKAAHEASKALDDLAESFHQGGNTIANANRQFAKDMEQVRLLENQGGNAVAGQAKLARDAAELRRADAVLGMVRSFEGMQREAAMGARMMEAGSSELIEAIYRANTQTTQGDMQSRIAAATEHSARQQEVNNGLLQQVIRAIQGQPGPAFAVGMIPGN